MNFTINTELLTQVAEGLLYILLAVVVALGFGWLLDAWKNRNKDKK